MCDMPQRFAGSPEERERNHRSHQWNGAGMDARCFSCDCVSGSVTSFWPCGVEPPRVRLERGLSVMVADCREIDEIAESEEREPW